MYNSSVGGKGIDCSMWKMRLIGKLIGLRMTKYESWHGSAYQLVALSSLQRESTLRTRPGEHSRSAGLARYRLRRLMLTTLVTSLS